ncbi:MAG: septum site-determining protein MinC [Chloroflexi bacterium]|nr:septum site-determining protein MinC [Chloroflexota bacterium]
MAASESPEERVEQPTPARPPVSVKGSGDGLRITVSRGDPGLIEASLRQHLAQRSGGFFADAKVALEMPPGRLDLAFASRLARLIEEVGMRVESVSSGTLPERREARGGEGHATAPAAPNAVEGALVIETTLRSGQRITHAGSVVILGDVNPGAEVLAGESVVVWGRLRGMVEAGLAADEGSESGVVVCALDLAPTQLRIGRAIARAPEEPDRVPLPEVARSVDGRIVVDAWR